MEAFKKNIRRNRKERCPLNRGHIHSHHTDTSSVSLSSVNYFLWEIKKKKKSNPKMLTFNLIVLIWISWCFITVRCDQESGGCSGTALVRITNQDAKANKYPADLKVWLSVHEGIWRRTADNVQLKRAVDLSACLKNRTRFEMSVILKIRWM